MISPFGKMNGTVHLSGTCYNHQAGVAILISHKVAFTVVDQEAETSG